MVGGEDGEEEQGEMTQHAERRRVLALFCDKLSELVAADDSMVGAFVVVMHEEGQTSAYYTPIPRGQETATVAGVTRSRNVVAVTHGVSDAMLARHVKEALRLEDGEFRGRA